MHDELTGLAHKQVDLKLFFSNGFGVSIVRHSHSYGGADGMFEVAVLRGNENSWDIAYGTPITGDVMGWLSWSEVQQAVGRVALLKVVERTF